MGTNNTHEEEQHNDDVHARRSGFAASAATDGSVDQQRQRQRSVGAREEAFVGAVVDDAAQVQNETDVQVDKRLAEL